MKRPLVLLSGIILSVILLSLIYPSNPNTPGILDRFIKKEKQTAAAPVDAEKTYSIESTVKISGNGNALAWSKDEENLYISKPVEKSTDGEEELYVLDSRGKGKKINSKYKFYNIRDAKLSPDGKVLAFISGVAEGKSSLYIYYIKDESFKDITPSKVKDMGVTSYDWDTESSQIIMSADIENPKIEIYSLLSHKTKKLDMKLKSCTNVSFSIGNTIIFSDENDDGVYEIYSADMDGKNIVPVIGGSDFVTSPDKYKIAILTDENGLEGLKVFNIKLKDTQNVISEPVYNIYWLSNSVDLMYSKVNDCEKDNTYAGNIYYLRQSVQDIKVMDVVYPVFVSSASGNKIALTSPVTLDAKDEDKGIFTGKLEK